MTQTPDSEDVAIPTFARETSERVHKFFSCSLPAGTPQTYIGGRQYLVAFIMTSIMSCTTYNESPATTSVSTTGSSPLLHVALHRPTNSHASSPSLEAFAVSWLRRCFAQKKKRCVWFVDTIKQQQYAIISSSLSDVEHIVLTRPAVTSSALQFGPYCSKRNKNCNSAASNIQRIIRGYQQRLRFRIQWLEHRIQTVDARKRWDLQQIQRDTMERKRTLKERLMTHYYMEHKGTQQQDTMLKTRHRMIAFLRQENEQLRETNARLAKAMRAIQQENECIATNCTSRLCQFHGGTADATCQNKSNQSVFIRFNSRIQTSHRTFERRTGQTKRVL